MASTLAIAALAWRQRVMSAATRSDRGDHQLGDARERVISAMTRSATRKRAQAHLE
jgi:hypothetical protein